MAVDDRRGGDTPAAGSSHPNAERLAAYAENATTLGERQEIEEHLAACADCRDVLGDAAAMLTVEAAPVPFVAPQRRMQRTRWMGAAVGVALAAGLVLSVRLVQPDWWERAAELAGLARSTDRLIADAYLAQRTVEFRLPADGYAPLRIERAVRGTDVNRTAPLLEAEARVTRALTEQPESPRLLQQKARLELLNWNYDAAIPRLQRARELQPNDGDLEIDLALAFFQRGIAEDRAIDLGTSLETLSRLLVRKPANAVALFNRIVVEERLMLYREALTDAEAYLRIEPSGGWADEVRQRAERVRTLMDTRARSVKPCSELTAETINTWAQRDSVFRDIEAFEGGMECLRQRAIVDLLPKVVDPDSASAISLIAFETAARSFAITTGDTWLREVTNTRESSSTVAAARNLAEAVDANLTVDAGRAEARAAEAVAAFRRAGNRAGEAQAMVEYSYAIRRRGAECRSLSSQLDALLRGTRWHWTALQARFEKATCLAMTGDRGAAAITIREVIDTARSPAYSSVYLRAVSYLQQYARAVGDHNAAWNHGLTGLRLFWSGNQPPVWAYQIYFDLAAAADIREQYRLALHLKRETLAEIQRANRPLIEAFSWFEYGRTARLADATDEAERALASASSAFSRLPRDGALIAALVECEIQLAEIELRQGQAHAAAERLERIAPDIELVDSYPVRYAYMRARSRAQELTGATSDVDADLTALVSLAEKGFQSLRSFREHVQWSRRTEDEYRRLVRMFALEKHEPVRALDTWEWYRAATFRWSGGVKAPHLSGSSFEAPGPGVAATLARQGIQQALIYIVLEDQTLVWHVQNGNVDLRTIAVPRATLERLVRRLRALCASPNTDQFEIDTLARRLSGYLLAGIERNLGSGGPIWVELDEALGGLPFALLPLESGVPIGDVHPIAVFPGVEFLRGADSSHGSTPPATLAVGLSALAEHKPLHLPPLPDAVDEARATAERFPASVLLLNEQATASAITSELPRASIFHFAGHSWNTANRVALLVASDASTAAGQPPVLDAETLAALDLRMCRLAVISACSAEASEAVDHSVAFGVVLALLRAGVRGVLATRWNLDSRVAVTFTQAFYDRLAIGESPIVAAHTTARAIRRAPGTGHPYYWAAYQFFGSA